MVRVFLAVRTKSLVNFLCSQSLPVLKKIVTFVIVIKSSVYLRELVWFGPILTAGARGTIELAAILYERGRLLIRLTLLFGATRCIIARLLDRNRRTFAGT